MSIHILGGGLAGTLIAYYLSLKGHKDFKLFEREDRLGGDHTWCFFDSDISAQDKALLNPVIYKSWDSNQVFFPDHQRTIDEGYNCIRSDKFHEYFVEKIPRENLVFSADVKFVNQQMKVGSENFEKADLILDARGVAPWEFKPCGYQKFYGIDLVFEKEHGLTSPVIMDATCEQIDGYRFIYILPFDKNTLLIEDTRYSDNAQIEDNEIKLQVLDYAKKKFGPFTKIEREESAALAIPLTSKQFEKFEISPNQLSVGLKGGWFNPITGYSLPMAVKLAALIGENVHKGNEELYNCIKMAHVGWQKKCQFYFVLNRMLFGAAKGAERRSIFQRFYQLPQSLIGNFYCGNLTTGNKMKLLLGRPPVPIAKAAKSLVSTSWLQSFS